MPGTSDRINMTSVLNLFSVELINLKKLAIISYRSLLRAQKKVFGTDVNTLNEAWNRTRREFEDNKNINDTIKLKGKIDEANQITQFLEKNLIQGKLSKDGSSNRTIFKVKVDERVEMWDYTKNGRPTCGCC